jgi:hypothetical protein
MRALSVSRRMQNFVVQTEYEGACMLASDVDGGFYCVTTMMQVLANLENLCAAVVMN